MLLIAIIMSLISFLKLANLCLFFPEQFGLELYQFSWFSKREKAYYSNSCFHHQVTFSYPVANSPAFLLQGPLWLYLMLIWIIQDNFSLSRCLITYAKFLWQAKFTMPKDYDLDIFKGHYLPTMALLHSHSGIPYRIVYLDFFSFTIIY